MKSLKKKISNKGFQISVDDQKLWFLGKYLSDNSKNIYESGLTDECEIKVYENTKNAETELEIADDVVDRLIDYEKTNMMKKFEKTNYTEEE